MDDLDSACNKAQLYFEQSEADRLKVAEQEADKCPDCEEKDAEIEWLRWHIGYISEGPKNHVTPDGSLEPWTAWREMLKNLLKNQGAESLEKFIKRQQAGKVMSDETRNCAVEKTRTGERKNIRPAMG